MATSWFSPKVEKRPSGIEGRGLFAREEIAKCKIVAVKGGSIMDGAAQCLGSRGEPPVPEPLLRSECGGAGQITFVTMRAVSPETELTIDYAMIDGDPGDRMQCACGAGECRGTITGDDWRRDDLRTRYAGYFSRYVAARFAE